MMPLSNLISSLIYVSLVLHQVCTETTTGVFLPKIQSISVPGSNHKSSIQVSTCRLECVGVKCQLSEVSSGDNFCLMLVRQLGDKIYFYQGVKDVDKDDIESTTSVVPTECNIAQYGSGRIGSGDSEENLYKMNGPVTGVNIWAGSHYLIGIQFQYGCKTWGNVHGENPSIDHYKVRLDCQGERITAVEGRAKLQVHGLLFETSKGRMIGPFNAGAGIVQPKVKEYQLLYTKIYKNAFSDTHFSSIDFVFGCVSP